MIKPDIYISDYTYILPEEKIAKYPLEKRDQSKLLIFKNKNISHTVFSSLPDILTSGSLLVFNNSKVIRARMKFRKETGATIEVFCLEPVEPTDVQQAFETTERTQWKCIIGNAKKWKNGPLLKKVTVNDKTTLIEINKVAQSGQSYIIEFSWDNPALSFADIMQNTGTVPIPPYLNRSPEKIDDTRYQTVYSRPKGSVAAPTAGLHFTTDILEELNNKNINTLNITLHVGAGTFRPVQTESISGHNMHTEHFVIERDALKSIIKNINYIIAVGTTSVRTLESLYWLGIKLLKGENIKNGIEQWDPYNYNENDDTEKALKALLNYMEQNNLEHLNSKTAIIIVPGYRFRLVKTLITNFHQPKSTLLLLIGAFIGNEWKNVYEYALNNDFRFLSYGDSSILFRE
ncbi:MAG: S-adenosylmethionine:tRNA ribosyltransferase-isomerase [Chlorobi bacterium]|nr:S-adenosylmethionine:tRNA ribosyltransferase-isomerase [Chlorobiota bacterium]